MEKIGKYRVLKRIGSGGNGCVYIVLDDRIGKKWAMKEMAKVNKGGRDGLFVLKGLDHPAIPRIVEELEDEYFIYEVMDYVEGVTLKEYARTGGIKSVRQLLWICTEISGIIAYLHGQEPPVIFRDVKPDNFIVTADGNIKLIDFDIAVLGEQNGSMPLGTKGYAAPEQHLGICSMATDVYSLGVTIAELARSTQPSRGIGQIYEKKLLENIIKVANKASKSDAAQRHRDAGEVVADLARLGWMDKIVTPAAAAVTLLVLAVILAVSIGSIYTDAYSSLAGKRARSSLEASRETADRIMSRLSVDSKSDVKEDLATFYAQIMEAERLSGKMEAEFAKEIREEMILYYELAGSSSISPSERNEYYRKAIAEILAAMENAEPGKISFLCMKAANLSRIIGDTGSAEMLYARFLAEEGPSEEEKISAWTSVIAMRLFEERNIDTAGEALSEVMKIPGAEKNTMLITFRDIIEDRG